jgi:hypothetical protein
MYVLYFLYFLLFIILLIPVRVTDLVIVTAHWKEDLKWLDNKGFEVIVCNKIESSESDINESKNYTCPRIKNRGNEASAFLNFIIHNYDTLPEYVAFIHGHESAWHQKTNILDELKNRRYIGKNYYGLNKSCSDDWKKGNPLFQFIVDNWNEYFSVPLQRNNPPTELFHECCAQFVTSREQIRKISKEWYQKWFDLCMKYERGTFDIGMVFEYMWHVIFGEEYVVKSVMCL